MTLAPFIRIDEVAAELGVSATRVYQLIASGELPAARVGGRIRIPRRAYELWIEAKNEVALASAAVRSA